jgi:hypothetical protein
MQDKVPGRQAHVQLLGVEHVIRHAAVEVTVGLLDQLQVVEIPFLVS